LKINVKNINYRRAGFIGSHVVRRFVNKYPEYQILIWIHSRMQEIENIIDIENAPNYTFIKGDIVDAALLIPFCGASI
jgi:dTDP-glucose 4,6-dehydratase